MFRHLRGEHKAMDLDCCKIFDPLKEGKDDYEQ